MVRSVRKKFSISRGLTIPVAGPPVQVVDHQVEVRSVALLGDDYIGMKPTMAVAEGDVVKRGQVLFEDRKSPGVVFTAPAAGRVAAVNRGAKRRFESLVIERGGWADPASEESVTFLSYADSHLGNLPREQVVENLLRSGLWPAFRTRPFSRIPSPDSLPKSIFVTAIDSNPLAADPAVVLQQPEFERFFTHGLLALTTLTSGAVYLCVSAGSTLPGQDVGAVTVAEFQGPHPVGLPGTHIHFLDPVNHAKAVWHIGYQDVVAVGCLFLTGEMMADRIISLAGPAMDRPRLVRTRLGASLVDLIPESDNAEFRVISGSVLAGRSAAERKEYLGRYHLQVSVLREGVERELLGWAVPGFSKFSVTRAFAAAYGKGANASRQFTTSTEGSVRAVVPIGVYERVMPLDLLATPLLKALLSQDTDSAQALGCLELDEEDLALCSFVCPGKIDYGPLLRQCLQTIEREG